MSDSPNFSQHKKRQNFRKELILLSLFPFASTKHADNTDFDPLSLTLSWIIRGAGGVTSDRHLTGSLTAFAPPYRKSASRKGRGDSRKKAAFTLAEVLITLGIIGIVVAMTIPTLVHKLNNIVLENQFKKAYSNLQNSFRQVINDDYVVFDSVGGLTQSDPEFGKQLASKYRWSRIIKKAESDKYAAGVKNMSKATISYIPHCSQLFSYGVAYELADGSAISVAQNCYKLYITIDTNGLKNKPNMLGYDIFVFEAEAGTDKLVGATSDYDPLNLDKCSKTATSSLNGLTCTSYAANNKCPWDSGKKYWDCLP